MMSESVRTKYSPAIPRKISRESSGYEENIGRIFGDLVRSITNRYPKLVRDNRSASSSLDLSKQEMNMIGCLNRSTTPAELIKIMFDNPPSVYAAMDDDNENTRIPLRPPHKIQVKRAPEGDIALAGKTLNIPQYLSSRPNEVQALNLVIRAGRNYLKAPKIIDGFSEQDINRRSLWTLGISTVLHQMTLDISNRTFITNKLRYDWDKYFQEEVWNNNRYAATRRDSVYMNFPLVSMVSFPTDIKDKLKTFLN